MVLEQNIKIEGNVLTIMLLRNIALYSVSICAGQILGVYGGFLLTGDEFSQNYRNGLT
jgi:hypothetical protein